MKNHENCNEVNEFINVRCVNPKKTGLQTDKVYQVTESKQFENCYILDVGWNWLLNKDMFEIVDFDPEKW